MKLDPSQIDIPTDPNHFGVIDARNASPEEFHVASRAMIRKVKAISATSQTEAEVFAMFYTSHNATTHMVILQDAALIELIDSAMRALGFDEGASDE